MYFGGCLNAASEWGIRGVTLFYSRFDMVKAREDRDKQEKSHLTIRKSSLEAIPL